MMKLSPIQLLNYHVTAIGCEACATFNPEKPMDLDPADLEVSAQTRLLDAEGDGAPRWAVTLSFRHEPVAGKNIPYRLSLEIVGLVTSTIKKVDAALIHAVEVNGPSMLFGAARELVRGITARGPYGPICIPSASFFTPPPQASLPESAPKTGRKKAAKAKR